MDLFLSDFDSYSESSSFEDQDDAELIYGGQACCILSSLEETIGKIDDFLSFERGFVHGDIVGLIKDPAGQMGRVTNINMIVDLENVHGNKMKHVDSRKLGKVRSISVGDFVVGGPWVGKVENIVDYVTILFDDGTKCEYSTTGADKIVPLSPDLLEDSQYPYYPGQRVRVELSTVPKSARWLCGPRKGKHDEGTVCAVDAGKVFIDWFDCALVSCEKVDVPQRLQRSKDLTVLSCFSHANWQLGDWCTLPLLDNIENASIFGIMKGHKQSERAFERGFTSRLQEIFVIVKTMTKVDVLWQDGSQSLGLDSHSLFPVNIVDAHDFWPDQFVLEKGTSDDPHVTGTERWGAVRTVDAKERTVRVKWESSAINRVPDSQGEVMEEIVSAYELVEHPDYSYSLGDVVFGMHKDTAISIGEVAYLKGDVCGREDYSKSLSNSYLSQIGFIVGFNNGNVEVKWGTGLRTKVAPHEIFRVDKREGLSVAPVLDETAENTSKTEHDNRSMDNEGKDLVDSNFYGEDFQKKPMYSSSLSLPRAALGYFTNIAANLFGSVGPMLPLITYGHISDFLPRPVTPSETEVLELCNLCTAELPPESGDLHTFAEVNSKQKIEETQKREEYPVRSGSNSPENFRQFDMVSDCSDHHFVNGSGKGLTSSLMNRGWLKKVQKEWSILEKDLPETIYVRIYEERMDLLRATIVGSPGTPYHDGLFFFDILFPPEYPHEPPVVHYNSGGLRVNPNLYESGKVCLSLLNTWTGSGSEVWNPGSSTILQVLLSLQALVLNEKPYFNEAGYDQQTGRAEGEKNSVSYNENAFLVSCKSMLYLLRKPPKNFEVLVEEHFRQRCKYILQACNAYMEGTPIGCAFGNMKSEEETLNGSSTGFKIMLGKLIPKLVEAFSDKVMDCSKRIDPAE